MPACAVGMGSHQRLPGGGCPPGSCPGDRPHPPRLAVGGPARKVRIDRGKFMIAKARKGESAKRRVGSDGGMGWSIGVFFALSPFRAFALRNEAEEGGRLWSSSEDSKIVV